MAEFKQLRIRAYLQCGVISDQFLPLDGVIYYHMVREKMGVQAYSIPGASAVPEFQNITLPLKKTGPKNEAWFYNISFAQWPEHTVEDSQSYAKRFDLKYSDFVDFGKRKGKVDVSRGQYKSYWINTYYRHALYVDWYCIGNKEELERLLSFCTHLGKKTSQGWGAVLRWEVVEWPEDWSIRGPQEKLMRAVPILGKGLIYGVRPPYWHPHHTTSCKMP